MSDVFKELGIDPGEYAVPQDHLLLQQLAISYQNNAMFKQLLKMFSSSLAKQDGKDPAHFFKQQIELANEEAQKSLLEFIARSGS